jgi:hypothetical protein
VVAFLGSESKVNAPGQELLAVKSTPEDLNCSQRYSGGSFNNPFTGIFRDSSHGQAALDTDKVEVDSKDSIGRTTLSWGPPKGNLVVAQLLLDTLKVDVDSEEIKG